jgi:hypothetical protein
MPKNDKMCLLFDRISSFAFSSSEVGRASLRVSGAFSANGVEKYIYVIFDNVG